MQVNLSAVVILGIAFWSVFSMGGTETEAAADSIELPEPRFESETSLEEALKQRRSARNYKDGPISLSDISQLLWAAQGITNERGFRTAPSAGALYPLEVYLVAGNVENLPEGVYKYQPREHALKKIAEGDRRKELDRAALGQSSVSDSAADIVIAAIYERTTRKYGERGVKYAHMEAGHAAQNIYLQAVPLGLGTVAIGAFEDDRIGEILRMEKDEHPLYIMPVGKK